MDFFHNQSIAVILWATSMVDTDSPNFNESYNNGYFIRFVISYMKIAIMSVVQRVFMIDMIRNHPMILCNSYLDFFALGSMTLY